jgi:hypothetical protein
MMHISIRPYNDQEVKAVFSIHVPVSEPRHYQPTRSPSCIRISELPSGPNHIVTTL